MFVKKYQRDSFPIIIFHGTRKELYKQKQNDKTKQNKNE